MDNLVLTLIAKNFRIYNLRELILLHHLFSIIFLDNSSCPIGWVGKDSVCYYFSTRKTSLSEARRTCFSKSAILSFPVNAVARKFIVDMVNSVPSIWPRGEFFVGVQTFNRGSYVVVASGKIIKQEANMKNSFNQLLLTWKNTFSKPTTSSEYFICEKFSGKSFYFCWIGNDQLEAFMFKLRDPSRTV